jgi:hypothetical protein
MKVLRTTDIITLKHEELEVDFSPLRYDRALELSRLVTVQAGKSMIDSAKQTALLIKYAVREIRGLTDWSNNPIEIKAGPSGELSDDDVSTAVSVLAKTPFIVPVSYISTSALPKAYEGIELLINGKAVELGN